MNAIGVTGEGKNRVHLAARQRRNRSLGTSDRRGPAGIHLAGTTSRPGAQMTPAAEDGDSLPTALAQDHTEAQNRGEHPGAASVPQPRAPIDGFAVASMPQRQAPIDGLAVASMPQPRAPIDGFAVASLITGILALIPLAAIFGAVALSRIGRTGVRGRALAITGLALAGTWAVVVAIAVAMIITQRPPAKAVVFPRIFSLRTGECINSAPNGTSGLHVPAQRLHEPAIVDDAE